MVYCESSWTKYDVLTKDVGSWQNDNHFKASKFIVDGLNVVNDPAERAVKLTTDFVASARGEDHFQNLLEVVECDRKARPNLWKRPKLKMRH